MSGNEPDDERAGGRKGEDSTQRNSAGHHIATRGHLSRLENPEPRMRGWAARGDPGEDMGVLHVPSDLEPVGDLGQRGKGEGEDPSGKFTDLVTN